MFNKFIATVLTGTLSLSAMSAFAVNNRVRLVQNCVGYDNSGRQIVRLKVNDLYPIVGFIKFRNGQRGLKILSYNYRYRRYYYANISTNCVEATQGIIVRY
ncbi:hypothetical protein NIES4071_25630 [Calothrix sp. NIES-4071]|nr:hypothetical protein NIES4071_25630 [Calothrix sp. NIES-4071]BAZ56886.1 hypothetical protein NIES4105_25570 [Calothrix sp. NIES-4105]